MPIDWDECCAYTTLKKVSVRHRYIGGVYYVAICIIFLYTIIGRVVVNHGYERVIDLGGAVRASIKPPATLPDIKTLSYCAQPGKAPLPGQLPCIYPDMGDGVLSRVTPGDEGALLVGTRLSETAQRRTKCSDPYSCPPWETAAAKTSRYVGGLENCTLMIRHKVAPASQKNFGSTPILDTFVSPRPVALLKSPLLDDGSCSQKYPDGRYECPDEISVQVTQGENSDIVTMGELLKVARVDLDGHNASLRYDGLTLRVRVVYFGSVPAEAPGYEYRVSVSSLEAKWETVENNSTDPTSRVERDLHGLQLLFSQDGKLRIFDLQALAMAIWTGVLLFSLAKIVADSFLLYCAPKRNDYRLFVTTKSPDFKPSSESERVALERALRRKRSKIAQLDGHDIEQEGRTQPDLSLSINSSGLSQPLAASDAAAGEPGLSVTLPPLSAPAATRGVSEGSGGAQQI